MGEAVKDAGAEGGVAEDLRRIVVISKKRHYERGRPEAI